MAEQTLNLGGNKENFVFAIDPETNIPCWAAQKDEFWLLTVGNSLYDYAKSHPILLMGSNLSDRNEFTFTMNIDTFDNAILSSQALYFRDMSKALRSVKLVGLPPVVRKDIIYIGIASISTDHMMNVVFEGNTVRVDVSFK